MDQPGPDDVVYYAAGPLDGQQAGRGRPQGWSAYREADGGCTRPAEGDRDLARFLRGGPDPALYVLVRSDRTDWWVYCWAPFLPSFVLANRARQDEPAT
jgi:hypothetical protein